MNAVVVDDIVRTGYSLVPLQLTFHEAGHAVIAHRCGRAVNRIEVNRDGGCTRSEGVATPLIGLLCAISGDRAEYLAPGSMTALVGFGHSRDREDAERCLNLIAYGPTEREWIRGDAIREVDKVLLEQQDRLDRLARHLLRRRTLEGRELRALLE